MPTRPEGLLQTGTSRLRGDASRDARTYATGDEPALTRSLRPRLAELLICISVAHLSVLKVIVDLPPFLGASALFVHSRPPGSANYAAWFSLLILIAFLLWATQQFKRRVSGWWGAIPFWIVWTAAAWSAANSMREAVVSTLDVRSMPPMLIPSLGVAGLAVSAVAAAFLWRAKGMPWLMRSSKTIMLTLLWPALFNVSAALWWLKHPAEGDWREGPGAKGQTSSSKHAPWRVAFLLLDEWDYRLTFESPKPDVNTAGFESLKVNAFHATNAVAPGSTTMTSVPSILSGKRFTRVKMNGPDDLSCAGEGEAAERFKSTHNLFKRISEQGWNVGVAGWYLPYCRLARDEVDRCRWWEGGFDGYENSESYFELFKLNARGLFETASRSPFGAPQQMWNHLETQRELLRYGTELMKDEEVDFVYIHLPFLHGPYYYDRQTRQFSRRGSPMDGYWDAVDRTSGILTELERELRSEPEGQRTILILTSDHPYRYAEALTGRADGRVPFIVKFPFRVQATNYSGALQVEKAAGLVTGLMSGEISSPSAVAESLEAARLFTTTTSRSVAEHLE